MEGEGEIRVKAVQMDNHKGLLGIMRMDRVPNAQIRELCGERKGLDERIDEDVLLWFSHVERMVRDRIQWVGHGRDGLIPCRSV